MATLTDTALTVRTEDLSVRFAEAPALDRLDLRLAAGKIHGLLGRNGSGKSTLAATLAGFRQPDEGRVLIEAATSVRRRSRTRTRSSRAASA